MLRKAFHTLLARISVAVASLLLVVLTSRFLGAEGRGEISLVTLTMALIMLGNDYLSGSSLVYFTPRQPLRSLLVPAYLWALVLCLTAIPVLYVTRFLPAYLVPQVVLITLLFCWLSAHYSVLLGKKMIDQRNLLQVLVALSQLLLVAAWFFLSDTPAVQQYINAQYVTFALCLFLSVLMLRKPLGELSGGPAAPFLAPGHIRFGILSQTGNLVIFLAYRFNFKVVEYFHGTGELGLYSTALTLAEAMLMVSQSIATVQQAHLVNSEDDTYRVRLALRNFKLVLVLLVTGSLVLACIPSAWYSWLLGKDFSTLRPILLCLLPGVVFLGLSSVISHYYAGTARFRTMLYANLLCLLVVACGSFLLIPAWGSTGAALGQSAAYLALLLFYVFLFLKQKKLPLQVLMPDRGLLAELRRPD